MGLSIFRVIERLGKVFRGPPRDAWLSSIAAKESRGYAFGIVLLYVLFNVTCVVEVFAITDRVDLFTPAAKKD